MVGVAAIREAELALMNAPFAADGWRRALESIGRATGTGAVHLAGYGGPLLQPLDLFVGREAERIDATFSRPELCGAANWRIASIGKPMAIQYERHYAQVRALGGTSDYDDAVADFDMALGCQAALLNDQRNFVAVALIRSRREGPTDEAVYSRFAYLNRHLQRAIRVQLAVDGEAAELMLGEIASMQCRTILLDRHGCLVAMTPSAEEIVEDGGPARLAGLGFELRDPAENRQMHAAMRRVLTAEGAAGPLLHQARVGRSPASPLGDWKRTIVRLPHRPHGLGFDAQLALTFRPVEGARASNGEAQ